jgi:SNF2 family DNA or RNA helicase
MPTQLVGAEFLAARRRALLADEPRVGKTGASILAAQKTGAKTILVVTTASGCAVWRKAFADWWPDREPAKIYGIDRGLSSAKTLIVSWSSAHKLTPAQGRHYDLQIHDEDHLAKNPMSRRASAVYGFLADDGRTLFASRGLLDPQRPCWHLTGTPMPHDCGDMYLRLRASAPERLTDRRFPNVLTYSAFRERYCVVVPKRLSSGSYIDVVVASKNEAELHERLDGFMLRRTQQDVGIHPPFVEQLPLLVSETTRKRFESQIDIQRVLAAIDSGDDNDDELARVRRLTGQIKAPAVAAAVKDEFKTDLQRVVLAYWHKDTGDHLQAALAKHGVARVDGSTPAGKREIETARFRLPGCRVFLAQLIAAGEAIDLSASDELWFVETSFTPKDISQMSARIANVNCARNKVIRFCTIANSIDEAMQKRVQTLSFSIEEVLK